MKAKSLVFAALAMVMAACVPTTDPNEFVPEFKVSGVKNNTIEAAASAREVKVSVTANISWSVTCQADWVSIDPASYTAKEDKTSETVKVTVSVFANELEEPRETELVFGAEGVEPITVTLKQAAKEHVYPTIAVVDDSMIPVNDFAISVKAIKSEYTFFVKATADWKAECPDWITLSQDSFTYSAGSEIATVTATFAKNYGEPRNGEIKFVGDFESEFVVPVSQDKLASIELTIGGVTFNSVDFATVPSDKEMFYIVTYDTPTYVNQFDNDEDFFASEIEFYEYLGSNYGMTLEEVISRISSVGDVEDYFVMDPDTEWVVYAYGLTSDGVLLTPIVKQTVHTDAITFEGTAIWHDVLIPSVFSGIPVLDMPCDVYSYDKAPGHYYFHSPYNFANIAAWFGTTPEDMYQYDGNWSDVFIDFDCTNPDAVVFDLQYLGCNLNSNTVGWMIAGSAYEDYVSAGVMADDTITFADPLLITADLLDKIYYANTDEVDKFTVKIDFNATESVYPPIPGQSSVSSHKARRINKLISDKTITSNFSVKAVR